MSLPTSRLLCMGGLGRPLCGLAIPGAREPSACALGYTRSAAKAAQLARTVGLRRSAARAAPLARIAGLRM